MNVRKMLGIEPMFNHSPIDLILSLLAFDDSVLIIFRMSILFRQSEMDPAIRIQHLSQKAKSPLPFQTPNHTSWVKIPTLELCLQYRCGRRLTKDDGGRRSRDLSLVKKGLRIKLRIGSC